MSPERALRSTAVVAGSLTESEATRRVFLAAGGLALLGLVLLVGTIWWWRSTRSEHPSLAPLEVMGARRWRKAPDGERQRLVDGVRPEGAQTGPTIVAPEPVDLAALAIGDHAGFDDLKEIDDLLAMDVDQLIGSRKAPLAAAAAAPPVEAPPADQADEAAEAPADETAAIGEDDPGAVAPPDGEPEAEESVDQPADVHADEALDDAGADEALDDAEAADEDAAADDSDEHDDEPAEVPGDPLLQRSLYD